MSSLFALVDHEVFLVTTRFRGKDAGQIATWVMPATLVPDRPRLVAIFSPQNFTYQLLTKSKRFVIHLLAKDQHHLVPRFGLRSSCEMNKFQGIKMQRTKRGLPIIRGACGWAACRVVATLDAGDRCLVLADIEEQHADTHKTPLRKNAAFEKASPEEVMALVEKRLRDGERDRKLMKRFR